jgi:putative endonuclease
MAARRQAGPAQQRAPREKDALGRWGEDLAAQHLSAAGMTVLARNWRCREGEIDLVARDLDGTIVFCEVKTRSSQAFGDPAEAVGRTKARRLHVLGMRWLQEHGGGGCPVRFDVIAVVRARGQAPLVRHLREAF